MKSDPPQYVPPPPDPALAILTQQNEQNKTAAIQDRVSADSARLMTMYGTRLATAGSPNWSPLIAPMPRAENAPAQFFSTGGGGSF